MAATYDLSTDFASGDGLATQVPYWVVGIARYQHPVTWDPKTRASVFDNDDKARAERHPFILASEVVTVRTSGAKEAHVTNLQATLYPHKNFLAEVMPGDWVVCCMLNSEQQGLEVARKMAAGEAVNGWRDGLKFVGKVTAVRKGIQALADGRVQTFFTLSSAGFSEFDSLLLYHPVLQKNNVTPASLHEFGVLIRDIVNASDGSVNGGTVDINKVLPKLIEVIFGVGAWSKALGLGQGVLSPGVPASPNLRYLVPRTVGQWLGLEATTYDDILRVQIGLQHYRTVSGATEATTKEAPWRLFQPDGPQDLIGWFPLAPPPTQGTVWDILSSFMNPPLNEMYLTLRIDKSGKVLPHFIARQTPYSTSMVRGALAEAQAEAKMEGARQRGEGPWAVMPDPEPWNPPDFTGKRDDSLPKRDPQRADATEFLELPRWKVTPAILVSADIGRSDALRFNLVHIGGTGYGDLTNDVNNFVRAPPLMDAMDIKRSGVRPYMTTVNCSLKDLAKGPRVWRDIMADIVMGQHLTLTGQFTCLGIQAPIAPGDNLEFDGLVFHIEGVQHVAGIQPDGTRYFQTILQVSHGVDNEVVTMKKVESGQDERAAYFAGTVEGEHVGTQTAVTTEEG